MARGADAETWRFSSFSNHLAQTIKAGMKDEDPWKVVEAQDPEEQRISRSVGIFVLGFLFGAVVLALLALVRW